MSAIHLIRRSMPSGGCVIALTSLASFDFVLNSGTALAGVRALRAGDVQELVNGISWTTQNTATEWIEAACEESTVGDAYEIKLTKSTGTTPTGPSLDVFHTINATQSWTVSRSSVGITSFTGTMEIREIADTANSVSAFVSLTAEFDI